MIPLVTTSRYDPSSGELVGSGISSISLGLLPPGSKSEIIVLDATISGVQSAGGLGFGLASVEFGGLPVSEVIRYDVVSSLDDVVEPTNPMPGTSGPDGSANVVNVGFRETLVSNYVVLMAVAPGSQIANGCFAIKWFFGFALEE